MFLKSTAGCGQRRSSHEGKLLPELMNSICGILLQAYSITTRNATRGVRILSNVQYSPALPRHRATAYAFSTTSELVPFDQHIAREQGKTFTNRQFEYGSQCECSEQTANPTRLQPDGRERHAGRGKRPRRSRLVSMLRASRNHAQAARAPQWTCNPRHHSLVCTALQHCLCHLASLGHLVGHSSLRNLQRTLCVNVRLALA